MFVGKAKARVKAKTKKGAKVGDDSAVVRIYQHRDVQLYARTERDQICSSGLLQTEY